MEFRINYFIDCCVKLEYAHFVCLPFVRRRVFIIFLSTTQATGIKIYTVQWILKWLEYRLRPIGTENTNPQAGSKKTEFTQFGCLK